MPGRDWRDWLDGGGSDLGVVDGVAALAVVMVLLLVVLPLLAVALEIVIALVLVLAGLIGRILLRRPWTVRAESRERRLDWRVVGWRESGLLVDEVAAALEHGTALPADDAQQLLP
ncbi:MAG TPA: hypothetical protein VF529_05205 [Solirubrobacteraceae bacterium]